MTKPSLPSGAVEVWHTTPRWASAQDLAPQLSARENIRAKRFRRADDRGRFMVTRCMLRDILARHSATHPLDLEFRAGRHGKPELEGAEGGLHFNLAHSGDLCVVAIAHIDVGIDVEIVRRLNVSALVQHLAGKADEELDAFGARMHPDAFFSLWTRREARAKLYGEGLGARGAGLTTPACSVQDLRIRPGYAAALAVPQAPRLVLVREWTAAL